MSRIALAAPHDRLRFFVFEGQTDGVNTGKNNGKGHVMKIGWIGGLDRDDVKLAQLAAEAGHELEFHTGRVTGHGAEELRRLVARSSVVIILTTVNSHGGVQLAKKAARKCNRPALVMQRCGQGRFRELLTSIDRDFYRTGDVGNFLLKSA